MTCIICGTSSVNYLCSLNEVGVGVCNEHVESVSKDCEYKSVAA